MADATWKNVFDDENLLKRGNLLSLASYAIESQYAASPAINALCAGFQSELDASADIDLIFNNLIDITTATGTSLDVWGRILAIPRTLTTATGQTTWDDDTYRFLLLYKALANISAADAATQNSLLAQLFGEQTFVLDNQNMTLRVVALFFPDAMQQAILNAYGLLTRGAGVGWELYQIIPSETFGFNGSELQPFNCAVFDPFGLVTMTE